MPLITRNSQNANVKLGTTAQLAAITFTDGDLASDTTLNKVKVFNGVSLAEIGATSFSSSAVVSQSTTIGDYTTPTAAVASSPANPSVEYLVIGGGGGGGNTSGGGGAGGYRTASNYSVGIQSYTVTVGAGGAAATNGSNSVFDTITSLGGGKGGNFQVNGSSGGSGGGAGAGIQDPVTYTGGAGTAGQGFAGGNTGTYTQNEYPGAGGGGSSSVGGNVNNVSNVGGDGGLSTNSSITGTSIARAGGGGGGAQRTTPGYQGDGGGGGAGNGYNPTGYAATSNTGSGGGGGYTTGGAGGSGIVILRYLTSTLTATGGTITTDGSYTIHSFTTSSSFVVTALGGIAENSIDNNTATKWTSSSETNPNIYVDMGSALNLCAAAFYFDSTLTTNTEILIQSSPDASVWTTRRTITESNLIDGAYNYYRFNIAGGARYIRFYGNSAGSTVLSIWEVKILKKTDAEIFNDLGILTITASDTALGPDGT